VQAYLGISYLLGWSAFLAVLAAAIAFLLTSRSAIFKDSSSMLYQKIRLVYSAQKIILTRLDDLDLWPDIMG
jgi:hypothetical protein